MPTTLPLNADTPTPQYDLAACRALMRGGSKSFFAASLLLPSTMATAAWAAWRRGRCTPAISASIPSASSSRHIS